jgi:hypothetical protein
MVLDQVRSFNPQVVGSSPTPVILLSHFTSGKIGGPTVDEPLVSAFRYRESSVA